MGLYQNLAVRAGQQRAVRVIAGGDRGGGDADRPAQKGEIVSGDHDYVSSSGHRAMAARRPADAVFSARSPSRRDLVLILPYATPALISRTELSSWRCRRSLFAAERVSAGTSTRTIWMPSGLFQQHVQ